LLQNAINANRSAGADFFEFGEAWIIGVNHKLQIALTGSIVHDDESYVFGNPLGTNPGANCNGLSVTTLLQNMFDSFT
jgi:hypothetical protein